MGLVLGMCPYSRDPVPEVSVTWQAAPVATALILVDVQRNMLEGDLPVPTAAEVRPALESLLARARDAGAVVVHVQNDGAEGDPDEPGTEGWELVLPAAPGEQVVCKAEPDTFADNPDLAASLSAAGVEGVVVAGMQSEYCIAATSRGALRHGFTVTLASDAHATYDDECRAITIAARVQRELVHDGVAALPAAGIDFAG